MAPGVDAPIVYYRNDQGLNAGRRFLLADERGSIIAVAQNDGALVSAFAYDEYGIPSSAPPAHGYTGQVWLAGLGMWYYKARVYSPTLGRFMQTDPIGYGDGMNWYGYVGGDPVNRSDPSGTECQIRGLRVLYGQSWVTFYDSAVDPNGKYDPTEIKVDEGICDIPDEERAIDPLSRVNGPVMLGSDYGGLVGGGGGGGGPQSGILEQAKSIYCSLPTLGGSAAARGYAIVGGGPVVDFMFDPNSGRIGFTFGVDVGVGLGGEAGVASWGNSATGGRTSPNGFSGSFGGNINVRVGPAAAGVSRTFISRNGSGFGGGSFGIRPGSGLSFNINLGVRAGYGGQIAPSCK